MQLNPKAVKKILIVRNDRFGEFLLNIPALRALKETFAGAKLIAVIDPKVRELAENIPFIDGVIEWGQVKHPLSEKLKLIGTLKKIKFDMAIILNPSKEFNIITYMAGIPIRVGYDRKWGFLLNRRIEDKKYLGEKHEVEYNLDLVNLVGARTDDLSLTLKINEEASVDSAVAIHPWTSDPVKQWPEEYFQKLAKRLNEGLNLKIIIIGKQEEQGRNYYDSLRSGVINMTNKTNLVQLAAILKKCRLLISGDSGPVHLAAAVGTPVLAIFRNDLSGKTAKRWGPWGKNHAVIERSKLSDITVDEVFSKAKEMLKI